MGKKVLIVAGEASGDMHAASLIKKVKLTSPDTEFYGIGGKHMENAGAKIIINSAKLAVVGIFEVLKHWDDISGALKKMRTIVKEERPDLLVLVDYPEFNLRLAKTAKENNIPVLFYISPQVWAWRQKRVHMIKKRVDMMAVVFPFEAEFYSKHGVPVRFVGHPLLDEFTPCTDKTLLIQNFNLEPDKKIIGLLPGSRKSELKRLLPVMLDSVQLIKEKMPNVQFILPIASTLTKDDLHVYAGKNKQLLSDIVLIEHRSKDVICVSDAVITASGTATLEIALYGTPMIVIYKISSLTYAIVKRLLKIDNIALSNIVAGKMVSKELLQKNANAQNIVEEVFSLLNNPQECSAIRDELLKTQELLGSESIDEPIESVVMNLLNREPSI